MVSKSSSSSTGSARCVRDNLFLYNRDRTYVLSAMLLLLLSLSLSISADPMETLTLADTVGVGVDEYRPCLGKELLMR